MRAAGAWVVQRLCLFNSASVFDASLSAWLAQPLEVRPVQLCERTDGRECESTCLEGHCGSSERA